MQAAGFCIFCRYASRPSACAHAVAAVAAVVPDAGAAPPLETGTALESAVTVDAPPALAETVAH